jgi:hypothetical protein
LHVEPAAIESVVFLNIHYKAPPLGAMNARGRKDD